MLSRGSASCPHRGGRRPIWLLLFASLTSGCAHHGGGRRIGALLAESEQYPAVADELNRVVRELQPAGGRLFVSKVSLEVAQLSVECVEPVPACYGAVGRAMSVDRLVFSQIGPSHEPGRALRVIVTLFDVEGGRVVGDAHHSYRTAADAIRRVKKLVSRVFAGQVAVASSATAVDAEVSEERVAHERSASDP